MSERRAFTRYPVPNPVIIIASSEFCFLGALADLSLTGVAFEYVDFGHGELERSVKVDIFDPAYMLFPLNLLCKVVYDHALKKEPSFTRRHTRRCGLQFQDPSRQKAQQIESLLTHCRADLEIQDPIWK